MQNIAAASRSIQTTRQAGNTAKEVLLDKIQLHWSHGGVDLPGGSESPPSKISSLLLLPCHLATPPSVTITTTTPLLPFVQQW